MQAACVEPPASGHGRVRSGGEASRRDHAGDAFFFWTACEAIRHHFRTAYRLTINGCWCQRSDMREDLDKCILIIYIYVIYLHYV